MSPQSRKLPHVVHITTVHKPDDVRIFRKICRSLAARGFRVSLVAPIDRPVTIDGVAIVPCRRTASRIARMTLGAFSAFRAARRTGAAIAHFHDPELIPAGLLLKAAGMRVMYDVHENLPKQMLAKHYLPVWARHIASRLASIGEGWAARRFDGISTVIQPIADRFPAAKTILVQNYPRLDEVPVPAEGDYDRRPPHVTYFGGISAERGVSELVRALPLTGHRDARLILAGRNSTDAYLRSLEAEPGWSQVDYRGWVDGRGVGAIVSSVRAGLCTLHPLPNYVETIPTKIYEYQAAGLPVIASDFPLWRALIEPLNCGLLVDPQDPGAIARAIAWILDHPAEAEAMGRRGRAAALTRFNWDVEMDRLVGAYGRLAAL